MSTIHLGVAALVLGVDAAWRLGHWGGPETTLAVHDIVGVVAPVVASLACAARSHRETGRMAVAWMVLALGALAWAAGDAWWAVDELVLQADLPVAEREVPFPGLPDLGYLAFLALAGLALVILPSQLWSPGARLRIVLDVALVATALVGIAWAYLLRRMVEAFDGSAQLAGLLGFAYVAGDLALVSLAYVTGSYAVRHERRGRLYLTLGLLIFAVTDLLFWVGEVNGTYQSGDLLDLGWPIAFFVMAHSAQQAGPQASDLHLPGERPPATILWLPILPVTLAFTAAMAHVAAEGHVDVVTTMLAVVALGLAVARHLALRIERRGWSTGEDETPPAS